MCSLLLLFIEIIFVFLLYLVLLSLYLPLLSFNYFVKYFRLLGFFLTLVFTFIYACLCFIDMQESALSLAMNNIQSIPLPN